MIGLDPLDQLRRSVGIRDAKRPRAGPVGPGTFEERARAYEEEMRRLHEAGADYGGMEGWRFMRLRRR